MNMSMEYLITLATPLRPVLGEKGSGDEGLELVGTRDWSI
jgi:hypothetical protein